MDTLEIEIGYIQQLMDDEVLHVLRQFYCWEMLEDCASVFDLDVSSIAPPQEVLSELIVHKSDEYLSEAKSDRFKAVWQSLKPEHQMRLVLRLSQRC